MIEYDAPHRTQTQILADDLQQAMRNLRRDWPHMIRPGDTQSPGWASRNGAGLDDHSFEGVLARTGAPDHDMRRIDRTISLRTYTVGLLNSWARLIVEDRGVTQPSPTASTPSDSPSSSNATPTGSQGMRRRRNAGTSSSTSPTAATSSRSPPSGSRMSLGACPLEIPGEQDVLKVCGGDVRVQDRRRTTTSTARCGPRATGAGKCRRSVWWAERMFLDGEGSPLVTIGELVAVIAYRLEVVVTHDQIRQWKHRGKIESAGTDAKGRDPLPPRGSHRRHPRNRPSQGGRVGTDTPNGID